MYNIGVDDGNSYVFITHNNPAIRPMQVIGKTLTNFQYNLDNIEPGVFAAHALLNVAGTDPKKRPSFHLSLRKNIGENHAPILIVSFRNQKVGWFHETGSSIKVYSFDSILSDYQADPSMGGYVMPRDYYQSPDAPNQFRFP